MKLGVIYTEEVHNAGYRALWPGEALRERGTDEVELLRYDPRGRLDHRSLLGCDVVHVFRRSDRNVVRAVDELRAAGVAITYDNDDDIRLAPTESANYKQFGGIVGQRDFRDQTNMMRRAHVVTTTTHVLAERFGAVYDGVIEVVPNYLTGFHFPSVPRNDDGVVIGWFAGMEHEADARRLQIAGVLQRVMERCPQIRVVTMGVRLDLDPERYTYHRYIPLHDLMRHVKRFDIGIAPIADIPMSYARSDVKAKEYAAAEVPWVASARGSYASLGSKCGGLLVGDDEWEEALLSLVGSSFRRAQLRRQGKRWAKTQTIHRNVDRWRAVWEKAIAIAADAPVDGRRPVAER